MIVHQLHQAGTKTLEELGKGRLLPGLRQKQAEAILNRTRKLPIVRVAGRNPAKTILQNLTHTTAQAKS